MYSAYQWSQLLLFHLLFDVLSICLVNQTWFLCYLLNNGRDYIAVSQSAIISWCLVLDSTWELGCWSIRLHLIIYLFEETIRCKTWHFVFFFNSLCDQFNLYLFDFDHIHLTRSDHIVLSWFISYQFFTSFRPGLGPLSRITQIKGTFLALAVRSQYLQWALLAAQTLLTGPSTID